MASTRTSNAKPCGRPKASAEPVSVVDIATWARHILSAAASEFSDDERAVLDGQVRALGRPSPPAGSSPPDPTTPTVVRERKALKQISEQLGGVDEVALDLETSSLDPCSGEVVGVGLSCAGANYYIPTGHRFVESEQLRPDQLPLDAIVNVLRLEQRPLIAHNAVFEFRWLRRHAGIACRFVWDVMLAARLLASHLPADLKDVAMRELDVPDWSLPKAEISQVQFLSIDRVARYCGKDCRYTLELYRRQRSCLA
jgi:DNA polymerase-1